MTNERTTKQLVLLPVERVPTPLRVSAQARRAGRVGIANVRAILADQARRQSENQSSRRVA